MANKTQILIDVENEAALKDAAKWMHPELYAQVLQRVRALKEVDNETGDFVLRRPIIYCGYPAIDVLVLPVDTRPDSATSL